MGRSEERKEQKLDIVKKAPHYNCGTDLEAVDVIEAWGFAEGFYAGQVIKYIQRYKHKANPIEDLEKARQYLDWMIKYLQKVEDGREGD